MLKYFKKLFLLNENHPDLSDLESLFYSLNKYLNNLNNKDLVIEDLVSWYESTNSIYFKANALMLLGQTSYEFNFLTLIVDSTLLPKEECVLLNKQHFVCLFDKNLYKKKDIKENPSLCTDELKISIDLLDAFLFNLSNKEDYLAYKPIIIALLEHQTKFRNLYPLLKPFKEEIMQFYTKSNNATSKLILMQNTLIVHLDFLFAQIGGSDTYNCFLAYETLFLLNQHTDIINFTPCKNSINFHIFDTQFHWPIKVINPSNFLFYFIDFLPEKFNLLNSIEQDNLEEIKGILSKYIVNTNELEINQQLKKIRLYEKKEIIPDFIWETEFDYLFDNTCYKDCCDCIEI